MFSKFPDAIAMANREINLSAVLFIESYSLKFKAVCKHNKEISESSQNEPSNIKFL